MTSPNRLMPFRVISYDGAECGRQARKKRDEGNYHNHISTLLWLLTKVNYPKISGTVKYRRQCKAVCRDYQCFEIAFLMKEKQLFKVTWVLVDYHQVSQPQL